MKKRAVSSDEEKDDDDDDMDADSDSEMKNKAQAAEESQEKKLSHKDKKKLKKQQEYDKQMELITKKGGQGHSELDSNFTVSQTQKTAGIFNSFPTH